MNIKSISPCPILEAVIQVNCSFTVDYDVVVGMIYSQLQNNTERGIHVERLPILNLPVEIRTSDPNLRDKAWYRISFNDKFILIGRYGVSFGVATPYKGWSDFKTFSSKIFKMLQNGVIKNISSLTLKYLNFFENINIFEKINCEIILNSKRIVSIPTILRTELTEGDFIEALQITNGVNIKNSAENLNKDGSIFELNLFTQNVSIETFDDIIEKAHTLEKRSFFNILSTNFIETYNIEHE